MMPKGEAAQALRCVRACAPAAQPEAPAEPKRARSPRPAGRREARRRQPRQRRQSPSRADTQESDRPRAQDRGEKRAKKIVKDTEGEKKEIKLACCNPHEPSTESSRKGATRASPRAATRSPSANTA
jgi:hypothetical protein